MTAAATAAPAPAATVGLGWRRIVAVLAVTQTVGMVALSMVLSVVLVPVADELGVSRTAVTGGATVSTLVGAAAAFPVGRLLDHHGGRWVMTAGSLIGAGAVVLWSQAHSLPALYAALALAGLGMAMSTYEAAFAVLVVAAGPGERDRAILTLTMIAGLCTYLVMPLLGWLSVAIGWRDMLLVLAALVLVLSVPGHLWVVPGRALHRERLQHQVTVPIGTAIRTARFWLLAVAFVAQSAATSAVLVLLVSYLVDTGFSLEAATTMTLAVGVLQILSRLVLTALGPRVPLTAAAAVAFAVQGLGLLVLPLVGLSVPLTVLCVAAVGLGNGVSVIARPSIVASSFGAGQFASILAALTVPMALARAGAPLGAAWLADWRFLVLAGLSSLVAAVALVPLSRRTPAFPPAITAVTPGES